MTPLSPAAGTEERGRAAWEGVRADSEWALFAWKRMRCRWCPWEGTRFMLIEHWLEAHRGRTDFELW